MKALMVDCLTPLEADSIVALADKFEFERAGVVTSGGTKEADIRTNSTAKIQSKRLGDCINKAVYRWSEQIAELLPDSINVKEMPLPGIGYVQSWFEPPAFLRYEVGEQYNWHYDRSVGESFHTNIEDRELSVVLYLNDDFEGGETEMLGETFTPVKGKALVFPSCWTFPHRSKPVTKGTKYAVVTWYRFIPPPL